MKLKVIWSEFAEIQLAEIFEYYKEEVNSRMANKLVREIINQFEKLSKSLHLAKPQNLCIFKTAIFYR